MAQAQADVETVIKKVTLTLNQEEAQALIDIVGRANSLTKIGTNLTKIYYALRETGLKTDLNKHDGTLNLRD